jgi:hypothetical protein
VLCSVGLLRSIGGVLHLVGTVAVSCNLHLKQAGPAFQPILGQE